MFASQASIEANASAITLLEKNLAEMVAMGQFSSEMAVSKFGPLRGEWAALKTACANKSASLTATIKARMLSRKIAGLQTWSQQVGFA
jgi:hypothetical protein